MVLAQERQNVREPIAERTKQIEARIGELETLFWTQKQTEAKRNTEIAETVDKALTHIARLDTRVVEFETAF